MKTPRELILERHQSAEAKLSAIRAEDLAACTRAPSALARQPSLPSLVFVASRIWQEAIWPWRRVWLGLAAAWLVIAAANLATSDTPKMARSKAQRPDAEILTVLREQKQLLAQLLEGAPPPAAPSKVQGPRSERRQTVLAG